MLERKKGFIKKIKNKMDAERFKHTAGVVESAIKLAEDKAVCVNKVEKAAFLHDIAKNKTLEEMQKLIIESEWKVDKLEMSIPAVLHAPAGAVIAEKEFGVNDKEILSAIRYHTLGHPDMCLTALIIFAADFIEPHRNFPCVEKIREIIFEDFTRGIIEICSSMVQHQLETAKIIHPNTVMLRNRFLLY
ncbi:MULTISPECIES: bis(5'-nucleosyl)-tetraphosphatase (symmetrical) YqeK [unclassified Halanaerobium]|uniref:bis(5'-nucleosyl)-tetraphosphatase (symmetrical) YqeK n=1 Tax=unclassified Halanaerobium TaxID=2641197 RepID=UPI000E19217E|nr:MULTISPECIES: bis(5'-nucleosyl)-tetraphosphatase (symmetrical) YqeK [unclassified Halanaerobium]RCW49776.1 putative HD superfamily hydrolase involved in NAD metabolism [Halanaerobium sp. MA284_MarDTE_T2]RCW88454.1 putative HD superfamily hydrolase involved in NAD metabolism [Halanaerobium sp. DL-01]